MATVDDLIADMQKQQAAAKTANLKRYADIKAGFETRTSEAVSGLKGAGEISRKGIVQRGAQASSAAAQDLVSRGLSGTTIAPTVQRGVQRETESNLAGLDERLRLNQAQLKSNLEKDRLLFEERREDVGPNMNLYSNLLQQAGRSQQSLTPGSRPVTTTSSSYLYGGDRPLGQKLAEDRIRNLKLHGITGRR